jgi:hypothetical protein
MVARNYWAPLNEVCASLSKCFYLRLFAISVLLWVLGEKCQFMALPTQREAGLPFQSYNCAMQLDVCAGSSVQCTLNYNSGINISLVDSRTECGVS